MAKRDRIHQARRGVVQQTLGRMASPNAALHPGLIPGISIEDTHAKFPTNRKVTAGALIVAVLVAVWAALFPSNVQTAGTAMREWVVINFGWLFTTLVVATVVFMCIVGYGPTGNVRLGTDDSEPEYSTASWVAMLFAAGLGIALLFYGPMEPLDHFLTPSPSAGVEPGSEEAILPAMSQTILHQASFAWAIYALVGGSLAYASYRRGRRPLISALFEPVFKRGSHRILGGIIDAFALLVTLFGTSVSLGIGALQIRNGTQLLTGHEFRTHAFTVSVMALLTCIFIMSAVSGIKRGIRVLSNTNMILVVILAVFVLAVGPTLYILNIVPASLLNFVSTLPDMLSVNSSQGPEAEEFLTTWTTMYWAWWVSWSPFVGMFIAKISKGRTLREFVTVVMFVPCAISVAWYAIFGGTSLFMQTTQGGLEILGSGENVMFDVLNRLPLGAVTCVLVMITTVIFFTTSADSATNVMASMSQSGRPMPSTSITIMWGLLLGVISIFLLLAGGTDALSGLQSVMVTAALPFAIILIGIIIAWGKDLWRDPLMIRRRFAKLAVARGTARGLHAYGNDFYFGPQPMPSSLDDADPDETLMNWYTNLDERGSGTRADRLPKNPAK